MNEQIWVHSRVISPEDVAQTCAFTTLPVRIHSRNDIAEDAAKRSMIEWVAIMEEETAAEPRRPPSWSNYGDLCSFVYPEAQPERLGLVTYLMTLGLFQDDVAEIEGAAKANATLAEAMDFDEELIQKEGTWKMKNLKKLLSHLILEFTKVDHDIGMAVINEFRKGWLSATNVTANTDAFETLEEYLAYRRPNIAAPLFWIMLSYSLGTKFIHEDYEAMQDVVDVTEKAVIFTNDYFSWYREKETSHFMEGRIVNCIPFFMKKESLPEKQAREKVRNLILEYEGRYLRERDRLYKSHPNLPFHLRQWTELCGCAISGCNFWSANCPRYNSMREGWKNNSTLQEMVSKPARVEAVNGCMSASPDITYQALTEFRHLKRQREEIITNHIVTSVNSDEVPTKFCKTIEDVPNNHAYVNEFFNTGSAKAGNGEEKNRYSFYNEDSNRLKSSILLAPCDYINSLPSKGIRSALVDALNVWLNVPEGKLSIISNAIKTLHNSSLILDDIEDNSALRRGYTATHLIFGREQAINSATYLFMSVVQKFHATGDRELMTVLIEESQHLFIGQSWDLYWKFNLSLPSENDYFSMIDCKTGAMFRMLIRLMEASSPLSLQYDFDPLARAIGRLYQIRDDYMNLQSQEYSNKKGYCEDLDEGKFSYPVVRCLNRHSGHRDFILGILRQRQMAPHRIPLMEETKRQLLTCFEETGTFRDTLQLLRQLEEKIEREIEILESLSGETNPMLRLLIKTLRVVGRGDVNQLGKTNCKA